jgi:Fe-S cluster biogenesis protein NfuA
MFIEVQDTPNPKTVKFVLGENILSDNTTYSFHSMEEAKNAPIVVKIMENAGVTSVFLGMDFISVSVDQEDDWGVLKPKVLGIISDFVNTGADIIVDNNDVRSVDNIEIVGKTKEEQEIINAIVEIFDERIRPAVAMDGGDIVLKGYDNGVVYISMHGACSGCPSSTATLKGGIENMLKYYIPEVTEVISVEA